MVLVTWSRLAPATSDPPGTRSDWIRICARPFALTRVCGPGLPTILAARGDRVHEEPPVPPFAATCSVTCPPRNGRKAMSKAPGSAGYSDLGGASYCTGAACGPPGRLGGVQPDSMAFSLGVVRVSATCRLLSVWASR